MASSCRPKERERERERERENSSQRTLQNVIYEIFKPLK
jgi:hypothetical protein